MLRERKEYRSLRMIPERGRSKFGSSENSK